jgi:2-polyprenyl-6-methoxyphenol hydroxylase-like FAD-dependent oxidoreductase
VIKVVNAICELHSCAAATRENLALVTNNSFERTTCCVVGGGPAGMMFGFLLARAGVEVTVLEKHRDFFRDFRGDTVHPSTLEVFAELGLLDEFLSLPHQKITAAGGVFGDFAFTAADFRHLRTRCRFVALMPQWDFLDFLAGRAQQFSNFRLAMEHEATGLVLKDRRITGVEVKTSSGTTGVHADLVVACDGRHSTLRRCAGLEVVETGVPIDVLWFRISRNPTDAAQVLGRMAYGKVLILINRGDYFQAGLIVRKGSFEQIRHNGLERFREDVARIAPFLSDRVQELGSWEQVKLLTVQINRLRKWSLPGLLCIGDAAHAMSPSGGVGINLAIQDAVAAARILAGALCDRRSTDHLLPRVQRRRELPTQVTQFLQTRAHAAFVRVFENPGLLEAPWQLKLTVRVPGLQRMLGHVIGVGVRPEHVGKQARGHLLIAIGCTVGAALALIGSRRQFARSR